MASVQDLIERQVLEAAQVIEDQIDNEIGKLEQLDEDGLENIRKKRLDALRHKEGLKQKWLSNGHGEYDELADEKEFFDTCKKSENVVCHFYLESTFRCKIVDKHLSMLSKKHIETRFCKINAEKTPFLAQRLKIRVIPTLVLCKDAKTKDFVVGFDDLGGTDEFTTEVLEWRIARSGVINYSGDLVNPPDSLENQQRKPIVTIMKKNIRGATGDSDSE